jgi:cytochrome c biogenesis protein
MRVGFGSQDATPVELPQGEPTDVDGYRVTFTGPESIPAVRIDDMPGAVTEDGAVTVQMPTDRAGSSYLYVTGIDEQNRVLRSGEPLETGTNSYTFEGRVEGAGIDVRRDPGDTFIWIAVGMALVGLSITFYVPRRRLWVKVTGDRTQIAGIAEKTTRLGRELRLMGAELGAQDALLPGDLMRDG